MRVVRIEDTILSEIQLPHARTSFRNYFGRAGVLADGPQAYLVHMPDAGSFVPPHFHDIDQFQIALEGVGIFGKKPWLPGGFFYADAYGPYGPIRAGDGGISFLTLRVASSSGQYDMPGSRRLIPGRLGKSANGAFDVSLPSPDAAQSSGWVPLAARPDGMKVLGLRLGANASEAGVASDGGGQYLVICSGSIQHEDQILPGFSLAFIAPNEPAALVQARSEGAVAVLLQFPRPGERLGSDPKKLAERDYSKVYAIA